MGLWLRGGLVAAALGIAGTVMVRGQGIDLPTSKQISGAVPGDPQRINGLPMSMAVSPDGRWVVTVNAGYGTYESRYMQSLAVVDTRTGKVVDSPDERTLVGARQTLYSGLAFSGDGRQLYGSVGSLSDPEGKRTGDTGSGVVVYGFADGRLTRERVIKIPLQTLAGGRRTKLIGDVLGGVGVPFPAGIAVVPGVGGGSEASVEKRGLRSAQKDKQEGNGKDKQKSTDKDKQKSTDKDKQKSTGKDKQKSTGKDKQKSTGKDKQKSTGDDKQPSDSDGAVVGEAVRGQGTANKEQRAERLLVADNLSDDVLLMDAGTGKIVTRFDLSESDAVPGTYPVAVAVAQDGRRGYVALWNASEVVELDLVGGKVGRKLPLLKPVGETVAGTHPCALEFSPDGRTMYVALANRDAVAAVDVSSGKKDLGAFAVRGYFDTRLPGQSYFGAEPEAMAVSADGRRLYVGNAIQDAVAVIDTTKLTAGAAKKGFVEPIGFVPTEWMPMSMGVAGGKLYVATAKGRGTGPNNFAQKRTEETKGNRRFQSSSSYIGTLLYGSVAAMDTTAMEREMPRWTAQVMEDNRMKAAEERIRFAGGDGGAEDSGGEAGSSAAPQNGRKKSESGASAERSGGEAGSSAAPQNDSKSGGTEIGANASRTSAEKGTEGFPGPIRHVIYIIKENRTYDQVFGDLEQGGRAVGNGDKRLTMYGAEVTPNQHKLALQFGVLDNFFDSGEVSGDGHVWSNAAIGTDYLEKTWQQSYRGKERTYDFEGVVAEGYPILQHIPDVSEPSSGYLWGNLTRHGRSLYHFGEYISSTFCNEKNGVTGRAAPQEGPMLTEQAACAKKEIAPGGALPEVWGGGPNQWPWAIPMLASNVATKPELVGHFATEQADFNLRVPDQIRYAVFERHFAEWAKDRAAGKDTMPNFVMLRFPNDHTAGTTPGGPTPKSSIADNDLAIGRAVDLVSHSAFWEDTAFFILEDDAQNGADHVDAHRSLALVVSKYAPRAKDGGAFVDSRFYSTVSMIRTMETVLGLPPMNNNDAFSSLMAPEFGGPGDQAAFAADFSNRENGLIYKANPKVTAGLNPAAAEGELESAKMDFRHADRADARRLNVILWRDAMGDGPVPAALTEKRKRSRKDDD